MTAQAVTEPYTYAETALGKGHIHRLEPDRSNRRVYVSYQPYVVWADGRRETLYEEANLGAAVWQLRLALGVES
jgi:hypothetical protein